MIDDSNAIKWRYTQRGFRIGEFTDRYGMACSIRESSIEACLWLGTDSRDCKILAKDAVDLGMDVINSGGVVAGWVDYPIPDQVVLPGRMHLTQDMAAQLIPILQHFVETGEIPSFAEKAAQAFRVGDKVRLSQLGEEGRVHTIHRIEGQRVFFDALGSYADADYLELVSRETEQGHNDD